MLPPKNDFWRLPCSAPPAVWAEFYRLVDVEAPRGTSMTEVEISLRTVSVLIMMGCRGRGN